MKNFPPKQQNAGSCVRIAAVEESGSFEDGERTLKVSARHRGLPSKNTSLPTPEAEKAGLQPSALTVPHNATCIDEVEESALSE